MKKIERDERHLVAVALANGGNVEDEFDAAEAVFDQIGWPVRYEWRIECARYETATGRRDEIHGLHSWTKPDEASARKACETNDHDPAMLDRAGWRAACVPFRIRRRLILEREVPR